MEVSTRRILKILLVLAWIIFIGLFIEAFSSMFSAFYTLVINQINAEFYLGKHDLRDLYKYGRGHYFAATSFTSLVLLIKAYMFYLIIKIVHDKKVSMSQPFNHKVKRFMIVVSYLSFAIGLVAWLGTTYIEWLVKQGIPMPNPQRVHLGGADVSIFMGITLFVIVQIFKRGIEIQAENDLTV